MRSKSRASDDALLQNGTALPVYALLSLGPSAWGVSAITVTRQGEPEPRLLISKQGVFGTVPVKFNSMVQDG